MNAIVEADRPVAEWWHCTRDEYDADTQYVRSSSLKDFWKCPRLYEAKHETGEIASSSSRPMTMGTALHSLVLEGKIDWKVAGTCGAILSSGKNKGNMCGKSAASDVHPPYYDVDAGHWLCGTHAKGKKVVEVADALTAQEDAAIHRMADSIQKNATVMKWLGHRFHEKAARSVDPETGVKKKALIDVLIPSSLMIADLKSTAEFNAEAIWRRIHKYGWGFSLAHYESVVHDVAAAKTGKNLPPFTWNLIIAESVPPYRVTDWPIDLEAQEICREAYRKTLREFAECKASGTWPQRELEKAMPQWFGYVHDYKREN